MELNKYKVDKSGIRLDKFMSDSVRDISRSKIVEIIELGLVNVNGKLVRKPSYKLSPKDVVSVARSDLEMFISTLKKRKDLEGFGELGDESVIKPEGIALDIIYEDDDLLVVDKPAGMVVHPGTGNYEGTLVNGLMGYFRRTNIDPPSRVGLVHRLDKDVSGLIVIAKSNESLKILSEQFSSKGIKNEKSDTSLKSQKIYWAVVETRDLVKSGLDGDEKETEVAIQGYVSRDPFNRKNFRFTSYDDGTGKYALSYLTVKEKGKDLALIEIRIVTGRTHQIRTQLTSLGLPIIGDIKYRGKDSAKNGIGLRCVSLKFIHPRVYKYLVKQGKVGIPESGVKLSSKDRNRYVFEVSDYKVPLGLEIS